MGQIQALVENTELNLSEIAHRLNSYEVEIAAVKRRLEFLGTASPEQA